MKVRISEGEIYLGTYEVPEISQAALESIAQEPCQEGIEGLLIPFDIVAFNKHNENAASFTIADGEDKYYFEVIAE